MGWGGVGFTALALEGKERSFCVRLEGRALLTKTLHCQLMVHSVQLSYEFLITPKQFTLAPPLSSSFIRWETEARSIFLVLARSHQ